MNIGKNIRIERFIDRKTKRTIIIPMDHGLTLGTIKGLEDIAENLDRDTRREVVFSTIASVEISKSVDDLRTVVS